MSNTRLHRGAAALYSMASSRSPVDTPEAHALKVGKLARKYSAAAAEAAGTAFDRTMQ